MVVWTSKTVGRVGMIAEETGLGWREGGVEMYSGLWGDLVI